MLPSSSIKSPAILSTKARLLLPVYLAAEKAGVLGDAILAHGVVQQGQHFAVLPESTAAAAVVYQEVTPRVRHLLREVATRDPSGAKLYDGRRADSVCPWQWAFGRPTDRQQCRTA